jgi:hypothetical protein
MCGGQLLAFWMLNGECPGSIDELKVAFCFVRRS